MTILFFPALHPLRIFSFSKLRSKELKTLIVKTGSLGVSMLFK